MSRDAYFSLKGGLDTATPVIEVNPGFCTSVQNWEIDANGVGYREHEGCERFDGQPLPSSDPDNSETLRTAIQPLPGYGPVIGIWIFEGNVYAFRNYEELPSQLNRLGMYKATSSGWSSNLAPTTLDEGLHLELVNYNFYADAAKKAMYGVDGNNPAFQFDGTTFTQISSGVTPDKPTHIAAHQYHLFLGFQQGSIIFSPVGDPVGTYTAIDGAGELGLGDGLTAMQPLSDEVMAIYGDESIHLLYGTGSSTFQLKTHSRDAGAYENSVQPVDGHLMAGPLGIRSLKATQAYGNFAANTISRRITDWLAWIKQAGGYLTGSIIVKKKNQYRLYFRTTEETYELSMSMVNSAFMVTKYPFVFWCVCSGLINGEEHIYAGADDGMVYRLDSGNSWDGDSMTTYLTLPWNHEKSPNVRKHFKECYLDIKGEQDRNLKFLYQVEYGDRHYPQGIASNVSATSTGESWTGDLWGFGSWNEGNGLTWTANRRKPARLKIPGSGTNIGMTFTTSRNGEKPITISSVRLQYEPRKHI